MKNKLPLLFLGLCLIYWSILIVVRVSAETATLNASGGSIMATGGRIAGTVSSAPPGPTYDTVPTNGLLMHYTLNGTSKEEVTSSNGTWTGVSAYTSDVPTRLSAGFGYTQSGWFRGSQNVADYRTDLLNGKAASTVTFWVKQNAFPLWNICVYSAGYVGWWDSDFRVAFNYSGNYPWMNSIKKPPQGQWVHVACTITNGEVARYYTNGVLTASGTTAASGTLVQDKQTKIASTFGDAWFLTGEMAQVLIYDRVLTTNEIYHLATGN